MGFIQDAERRERIIDGAIRCLAQRGWTGTTMAAIAGEVGISRGLISYHFRGGKDALIDEVLTSIVDGMYREGLARMERAATAEPTAAAGLRAYIAANLEYLAAHPLRVRAVGQIMANLRKEDGSPRYDEAAELPVIEATAAVLERGQATGEFRAFDSRAVAFTLRRAIDGAARRLAADPGFDIVGYGHELAELFVRGCLASRPGT